jgi:hypothetical protein
MAGLSQCNALQHKHSYDRAEPAARAVHKSQVPAALDPVLSICREASGTQFIRRT